MNKISRRDFIRRAATVSAAAVAGISIPSIVEAAFSDSATDQRRCGGNAARKGGLKIKDGAVILFQGDSITDNGRKWDNPNPNSPEAMGYGYAAMTGADILLSHAAQQPVIFNRGIGGQKVFQLAERWQRDCYDLKPDILSILIGVNDYWHTLDFGYDGTPEIYLRDYLKLIGDTKQQMPDIQLVICEPFAVKDVKVVTDKWYPEFDEMRAAAKEVADTYNTIFVPYQSVFDEAAKVAPASYWTSDGVHSSMAGSRLMATAWLKATGL